MTSTTRPRLVCRFGFIVLLVFASGLAINQHTASGQQLLLDFTTSGSDINSPTLTATGTSGGTETITVWAVATTGSSSNDDQNSDLGITNLYWAARASMGGSGTFTNLGAGSTTGALYSVGVTSAALATGSLSGLSGAGAGFGTSNAAIGDWTSSHVNEVSTTGKTNADIAFATTGGAVVMADTGSGEALSGTNTGWAWEIGTMTVTLPTITSGSATLTFTPSPSGLTSGKANWTDTGGTPVSTGVVAGADAVTFTVNPAISTTPGLTLAVTPARQIIGPSGAISVGGNVTNTGGSAYNFTGFTDNSTGGGSITGFSPSSGTVGATDGSQAYTATAVIAAGTTPGSTATYQATVTDGTTPAQSGAETVTAVVSRAGSTGFSIGTANLGSAVYADGPGAFGAPTLSGTSAINGGSLGNNAATNLTIGSGSFGTLTATQSGGVANGLFNAASQSGTWTVSGAAPTMSQITGTSLIAANNVVNGTISMSTTGEGLAGEVTTVSIPYTYSTVGNAAADISGNGTFGGAAATASINSDGGSFANGYAGLAAQAAGAFTGNGTGGAGLEHSVAEILMGSNSGSFTGNQAASVGILMRNRMLSEAPGNDSVPTQNAGFPNGTPTTALPLISDVARLYGLNSSATPTASGLFPTDPFAFEMSFNPGTLNAEGAFGNAMASRGNLYLASLIGGAWQNTIVGDFATGADDTGTYKGGTIQIGSAASTAMNGNFNVPLLESFATFEANDDVNAGNLGTFIGVWGVDTTNDEAWAVINHDSDFAVVPEPSTIVLALFGLLGGALALRRKKTLAAA